MRLKTPMPASNKQQFILDSNFLIALLDREDVHHSRAKIIFTEMEKEEGEIFLSDVLINETLSVMARRAEAKQRGKEFQKWAKQFQKKIEGLPIVCLYEFLPGQIPQIMALMAQYDGCFNFHDALFLFFMQQLPKVRFVTFDKDFSKIEDLQRLPV